MVDIQQWFWKWLFHSFIHTFHSGKKKKSHRIQDWQEILCTVMRFMGLKGLLEPEKTFFHLEEDNQHLLYEQPWFTLLLKDGRSSWRKTRTLYLYEKNTFITIIIDDNHRDLDNSSHAHSFNKRLTGSLTFPKRFWHEMTHGEGGYELPSERKRKEPILRVLFYWVPQHIR